MCVRERESERERVKGKYVVCLCLDHSQLFTFLYHHRLTEPEPPSVIQTLFRRGTSFRYSGRTYRQTLRDKSKPQPRKDVAPKPQERTFVVGTEVSYLIAAISFEVRFLKEGIGMCS